MLSQCRKKPKPVFTTLLLKPVFRHRKCVTPQLKSSDSIFSTKIPFKHSIAYIYAHFFSQKIVVIILSSWVPSMSPHNLTLVLINPWNFVSCYLVNLWIVDCFLLNFQGFISMKIGLIDVVCMDETQPIRLSCCIRNSHFRSINSILA